MTVRKKALWSLLAFPVLAVPIMILCFEVHPLFVIAFIAELITFAFWAQTLDCPRCGWNVFVLYPYCIGRGWPSKHCGKCKAKL